MFSSNSTWKENKQLERKNVDLDSLTENHKEFTKNNKLILESRKRFRSEKHDVFTEKVNKIALSANDDKIIHFLCI